MTSFPLMSELPRVIDTTDWIWERFNATVTPSCNFWIGIDHEGSRWLTKLRGVNRAYREIVFAQLAQAMGWSCQSSVFMRIDRRSAQKLGVQEGEVHAAHWFLDEHPRLPCSLVCALDFFSGKKIDALEDLLGSTIAHLMDWPKSEFAAYLFGGTEIPGGLFTAEHEFVIIDSELMFASQPCEFETCRWWNEPSGQPSRSGRALAFDVCNDLLSLSEREIREALTIPVGIDIPDSEIIGSRLRASRNYAAEKLSK